MAAPERLALDDALLRAGSDAVLRRIVGTAPNQVNIDVTVRARVNSAAEQQIVGGIGQVEAVVIMSPTQIMAAQWPGGNADQSGVDPSLPRRNDRIRVAGRWRNVEKVDPFYVGNELVRLELQVTG